MRGVGCCCGSVRFALRYRGDDPRPLSFGRQVRDRRARTFHVKCERSYGFYAARASKARYCLRKCGGSGATEEDEALGQPSRHPKADCLAAKEWPVRDKWESHSVAPRRAHYRERGTGRWAWRGGEGPPRGSCEGRG